MFKNTKRINELNTKLNELSSLVNRIEAGIMHDDYPKCLAPEDCGFSLCKHGRLTIGSIKSSSYPDEITFNNGEMKGRMNKKIIKKQHGNKTTRTPRD